MFVDILPETKTWSTKEIFTYSVPDNLMSIIKLGQIVLAPFGKRRIRGVVVKLNAEKPRDFEAKNILECEENNALPAAYLDIIDWISNYYFCSAGDAFSLFLPPSLIRPRRNIENDTTIQTKSKSIELSSGQKDIFDKLATSLTAKTKTPALIHGVTGSGKTEIYIKLAQKVVESGKSVIVLVPEISLTPQTVDRFCHTFYDNVCIMHSGLSKSERLLCYQQFSGGEKKIIIGPRSALLVPNQNIGLIIIDEEQEDAYKQDQSPRYHAVTLAEKIASKVGALLLLGSATPRIETYYKAKNGKYDLFTLKDRYNNKMPRAELVDLKDEIKYENFSPISRLLHEKIAVTLDQHKQVLLFLNRRGSATFVSCRDCGHVVLCHNCSVPMVYHENKLDQTYLSCHHCNSKSPIPVQCPECHGFRIKYFGTGIDKIEKEIRRFFPDAKIKKIDSTTLTHKNDYQQFYSDFKNNKYDIIIGTQIIAKGLDIPNVDLVGIVSADTGLHLPQYLSSEKSFRLLTQVSGRSGRRDKQGLTIFQTYWPDSLAIQSALNHDYDFFYQQEIAERKKFAYPPFVKLIRVISENKNDIKAKQKIDDFAVQLKNQNISFIGPGECFYHKLHGKYRHHVIIKNDLKSQHKVLEKMLNNSDLIVDVDPVNLL